MKVRIGFLHNQEEVSVELSGKYDVVDSFGNIVDSLTDGQISVTVERGIPATFNWYDKLDTFYEVEQTEEYRDKYFFKGIPVRILKVGCQINAELDNFEYWVLRKREKPTDIYYERGDYRCKKIVDKKGSGFIKMNGQLFRQKIRLIPLSKDCSMTVEQVKVGIGFHWEHKEKLEYEGEIEILIDLAGKLTVVNTIELEKYLASVNSSEMRNDNNREMLKAQTVAARGTVLATMGKHHYQEGFDLCGDDHCQCYQGTRRVSKLSKEMAEATCDEVLFYEKRICDTRYSKICGGITEKYSTCWEDQDFDYFQAVQDRGAALENGSDASSASAAAALIDDHEFECFCNTKKYELPQSLEFCKDGFRWQETISIDKLNKLIKRQISQDIGGILDLIPMQRGPSGRISHLKLVGEKSEIIIFKELKIRNLLSDSHLFSSCFYVKKVKNKQGKTEAFVLHGAGWGHGVGLCQVGAQVMGQQGYSYEQILSHYYRKTTLKKLDLQ